MTVQTQLVNIRKASEVTHQDKPPDMLSKRTENGTVVLNHGQNIALRLTSIEA